MTTTTFVTAGVYVNTDARYRAIGAAINGGLAAIGLVQTADTGQVNWATATFPALNSFPHYEIWRFNDALQATAPIFFKLWYGAGNSGGTNGVNNNLQLGFEIGTATNGAGTLSGVGSSNGRTTLGNVSSSGVTTNVTSYMCMSGGNMNVGIAANAVVSGLTFAICRTQDSSGVDTGEGAFVLTSPGGNGAYFGWNLNFTTGTYLGASQSNSMLRIGNIAASAGGDTYVFPAWLAMPTARPVIGVCGVIGTEVPGGTTFSATLFGSTAHTYMSHAGRAFGFHGTGTAGLSPAVIWE